ncbi:MAG: cytidylate kinase-like family protein [Clostridiales bacterium]|nr:cytidylate kinase-like family protein [Clostridiales bacterium]
MVEVYGEREDKPDKRIKDKDKRRKTYYERYTGRKWGDVKNYDIALNAEKLSIDTCVQLIIQAMG